MLELNAGTGIDAVYFACQGINVLATDNSDGMLDRLSQKASDLKLEEMITVRNCSFLELNKLQGSTFDYIFSDFGGLNCTPDLQPVLESFNHLLKPGGFATLVIMPPVCPWEILSLFKGNSKLAFRRFKRDGAESLVEGIGFKTYYFKPSELIKSFGKQYERMKLQGLGSVSPPPYKSQFAVKFPSVYSALIRTESRLSEYFPFNSWADHFILTMKRKQSIH